MIWSTLGNAGTGGTSRSLGAGLRPGEGVRKVRSIIEPTLGVLVSSRPPLTLPVREVREGLLLCALFDCTSATFVGVIGRALRAAAAAAEDKDEVESRRLMNTAAAAVAALGFAVSLVRGYRK